MQRNRSQGFFCDHRSVGHRGQGQDVVLDLRRQANEGHNLGHSGAGDTLATGNLGLGANVAGVKLAPPLLGHPEEFYHPGCLRLPWGLGWPPGLGGHVHDPISGDAPLEGAYTTVLERPLWP